MTLRLPKDKPRVAQGSAGFIYLASTSPRRKKILKDLKVAFKVIRPDYQEKNTVGATRRIAPTPAFLVKKHALAKALSCVGKIKEGRILGSDTLVYCGGKIIGKPKNRPDAFKILKRLEGRWHVVYTGVAILEVRNRRILKKMIFSEKTRVRLKPMDRAAIGSYLKKIDPMDKAGAYAIQSNKVGIVAEVRGSISNAIGLPVERLKRYL